jgi:DNA-binding CsgD family transcriptional regulator
MGAPLCCLYALALAEGPLGVSELRLATGYGRAAVGSALYRLKELGFVEYDRRTRLYTFDQSAFARALTHSAEEQDAASDMLAAIIIQDDPLELEQRRRWEQLTPREQQVLLLISERDSGGGPLTNQQIAERLSISEETVRDHIRSLRAKLGAKSKADLRCLFRSWKFVPGAEER